MARKVVLISDLSGETIENGKRLRRYASPSRTAGARATISTPRLKNRPSSAGRAGRLRGV
jgi:hypothetical protein